MPALAHLQIVGIVLLLVALGANVALTFRLVKQHRTLRQQTVPPPAVIPTDDEPYVFQLTAFQNNPPALMIRFQGYLDQNIARCIHAAVEEALAEAERRAPQGRS